MCQICINCSLAWNIRLCPKTVSWKHCLLLNCLLNTFCAMFILTSVNIWLFFISSTSSCGRGLTRYWSHVLFSFSFSSSLIFTHCFWRSNFFPFPELFQFVHRVMLLFRLSLQPWISQQLHDVYHWICLSFGFWFMFIHLTSCCSNGIFDSVGINVLNSNLLHLIFLKLHLARLHHQQEMKHLWFLSKSLLKAYFYLLPTCVF